MKLTDNFAASEFFVSKSNPHLVDSWDKVSPTIQNNLKRLAKRLQALRDITGRPITITSGYRGPKLNAAVGGASKSYHTKGLAADINIEGMTAKQVQRSLDLLWDGGLGYGDGFTHLDLGPRRRFNY